MRWVVLLMAFFLPALAQEAPPPDLPPEVFRIARELRCPVCQGESAAESNSGVAVELRRIIAVEEEEVCAQFDAVERIDPRSGRMDQLALGPTDIGSKRDRRIERPAAAFAGAGQPA